MNRAAALAVAAWPGALGAVTVISITVTTSTFLETMGTRASSNASGSVEVLPWGFGAHEMGARAAINRLPNTVPEFFRDARHQLAWLNPEPDRWRDRNAQEMDQAWRYDHYVDLENVPPGAMDAPDRFTFIRLLSEAGVGRPERDAGFVHYRILELHERLTGTWRAWRDAESHPERRAWLEQRIVNDAGILGHYVMDASQPHHTTIHFNGWDADTPNPEGYTSDRDFHARFEQLFVDAHVEEISVHRATRTTPATITELDDVRRAVRAHIDEAHARVEELYRLDRDVGFDPDAPAHPDAVSFAVERIASGSGMLATLWWSAWVASGT